MSKRVLLRNKLQLRNKMKISVLVRTVMAKENIKSVRALSKLSGVSYSTVNRVLDDENVGVLSIVKILNSMGYQLKAEVK